MFTATQTELGKSDDWFWETEPRIVITMLEEKKKIDAINFIKQASAIWGGKIYDEEDDRGVAGIDYPADEASIGI